jgi:hypothetical protein
MLVNLLLNTNSFQNTGESLEDVYERIDVLDSIISEIENINEKKKKLSLDKDMILKDLDIYNQIIFSSFCISDFIYGGIGIDRDYQVLLRTLIDRYADYVSDETANGQICFFNRPVCNIHDKSHVIDFYHWNFSNLNNGTDYFNGIKIHFKNVVLSDHVENSLTEIQGDLGSFSEQIVKTLIYLNDSLQKSFKRHNDVRATLEELTSVINIHSSVQGKSKELLCFDFKTKNGRSKSLCCDPHVKYNRSEDTGIDKEYYRMYFHTGDNEIAEGKVPIGHIGIHLGEKKSK